jgi:hypothetical protein
MRAHLLALPVSLAMAGVAAAQVPAGGEFRANTFTPGNQWIYSTNPVAVDSNGNFVVVWHDNIQEGPLDYGIFGQRFDATGTPRGSEFHVNEVAADYQGEPSVATLGRRGRFVVVWESAAVDGSGNAIRGRLFDGAGSPLAPEFQVNTYTTQGQYRPAVAADAAGNFVVVWQSEQQDGSYFGIFGQRFGPSGERLGGEFQVNTFTNDYQRNASVAVAPNGQFAVAWTSNGQDGDGYGLFAQRFAADGSRLGAEFQVNTSTLGSQGYRSSVAPAASGGFVFAWAARPQDGDDFGIAGRRFDGAGAPLGGEFQVNTYTTNYQGWPRVASDAAGDFTVVWDSRFQDGSVRGVFGQRFDASGARRGGEFRVNSFTSGDQNYASIADDGAGNFIVAWSSRGQDAPNQSVSAQAQRYGGLLPAALAVDTAGNGVLEPGESVDVRPSWRNVNGQTLTFGGTAPSFTGPAGAVYTITDGTASYGTVANGDTAQCSDCYGVSVSDPSPRPAAHWDATLEERITPDTLGQDKLWRLHVGDSFDDVPRANPFYRFVETLFHHGVTGGCGAAAYCPASSTTREQMAVFMLRNVDPANPPPCAPPNLFADVPETSPFCRWIEELARRGVVGGCGGGNYCPTAAVTREQMAVFVLRTLDPALNPPPCTVPIYNDVPATSGFCRWIEELTRRGVVTGCGGGNYCPTNPVTREQMGVFISATFGLTLYGP